MANRRRNLRLELLESRQVLATFNLIPGVADGQPGSLRDAISQANTNGEADVINLVAGEYPLTLTGSGEDANQTGDLDILNDNNQSLVIRGVGGTGIVNAGAGSGLNDRVLQVFSGATVTLENVRIWGGDVSNGEGGGIYNAGILTLDHTEVRDNISTHGAYGAGGGGITNENRLTIRDSVITNNTSSNGGGILNHGTVQIYGSEISNNTATVDGGGVFNWNQLNISNSEVNANNAADGSAIFAIGIDDPDYRVEIVNSTVSANVNGSSVFHLSNIPALISRTEIRENSSDLILKLTDTVLSEAPTVAEFENALIVDNFNDGTLVEVQSGMALFRHATIANNGTNHFGGMFNVTSKANVRIDNSIVWDNLRHPFDEPFTGDGVIEINNSIVEDRLDNIFGQRPGQHISVADPLFFDSANGDYRITENSPAVDFVNNGPTPNALGKQFDIQNQLRPRVVAPVAFSLAKTASPFDANQATSSFAANKVDFRDTLNSTVKHVVRVARRDLSQASLSRYLPSVERLVDYGEFAQLELTEEQFRQLKSSGLRFESVSDYGVVSFGRFRFDPVIDGEPNTKTTLTADTNGKALRFVQFRNPPTAEEYESLASKLEPIQYYPRDTYLVWADQRQLNLVEQSDSVRWTGDFHTEYRVSQRLANLLETSSPTDHIEVDVTFFNNGHLDEVSNWIIANGGTILHRAAGDSQPIWYAELPASKITDLAQLPVVIHVSATSNATPTDESSSQIIADSYNADGPVGRYQDWLSQTDYDGSGVKVSIIDTGVDWDHPDLNVVSGYERGGGYEEAGEPGSDGGCAPNDDSECGGHGTHVAGIVAGRGTSGITDDDDMLYGLGVAPGASLHAIDYLYSGETSDSELYSNSFESGAALSNNSWGNADQAGDGYTARASAQDMYSLDAIRSDRKREPFLAVFAAGNYGCDGVFVFGGCNTRDEMSISPASEAKNVITVGNTKSFRTDFDFLTDDIDEIAPTSSLGNAVDGRIKPDVVAPGSDIVSTSNTDGTNSSCNDPFDGETLYASCTGTSMASPQVAGAAALFTEFWQRRTKAFSNPNGDIPEPATVKAALIATTDDLKDGEDGTGETLTARPNIHQGWGRVNIDRMLSEDVPFLFHENPIVFRNTGQFWETEVEAFDLNQPLRVTLVWSDRHGAPDANPALVNDLDLQVTLPDGQSVWRGNVFADGWSTGFGEFDRLNNVENVWIETPQVGTYKIRVSAAALMGDAWLYDGDTPDQHFSLVVHNGNEIAGGAYDAGAYEFPPILVVNDPGDFDDGNLANGTTTLREAINVANRVPGHDLITFDLNPAGATINLSGTQFTVTDELTIRGPGADRLTIDAQGDSRVIHSNANLTLSGVTLTNGNSSGEGGALYISEGKLTEIQILSSVGRSGGGIYVSSGAVTIEYSTIADNQALSRGGGIYNSGGALTLTTSTISGNRAVSNGGGLANFNSGILSSDFSTITDNRSDADNNGLGLGGGIHTQNGSSTNIRTTIVAGNYKGTGATPFDLNGQVATMEQSLIGDPSTAAGYVNGLNGNIIGVPVNAVLNPSLEDRGGTTLVHALAQNSVAIDVIATGQALRDQRGVDRPKGNGVDIGAYEFNDEILVVNVTGDDDDLGSTSFGDLSLRKAIRLANERPGANLIQFDLPDGSQTIELNNGPIQIRDEVTILGPGPDRLVIDAVGNTHALRVFHPTGGIFDAEISNLAITGASSYGILNNEQLLLNRVHIFGNDIGFVNDAFATMLTSSVTDNADGGIANGGSLTIANSTIANNARDGLFGNAGAGILNLTASDLTILSSTIAHNRGNTELSSGSFADGGGIRNERGTIFIANSIVAGNTSGNDIFNNIRNDAGGELISYGNNVIETEGTGIEWSGNRHSYQVVNVPGGITWEDAFDAAHDRGGYLATITSAEENSFVSNLINGFTWIGGQQTNHSDEPAGFWKWVNGEPFDYTNWAPNEPNNSGGSQDVMQMYPGGTWDDDHDTTLRNYYVVEYDYGLLDPSDQLVDDAHLAPLANYGGPLPTVALLPNSPAVDAAPAVTGLNYDQVVVANSPTAYFRFDERVGTTAADSSGNGHHGTYVGGVDHSDHGVIVSEAGSAVRLDGQNDNVTADIPVSTNLTVSGWARSSASLWDDHGWIASARGPNGFIIHPNEGSRSWNGYILDSDGTAHSIGNHEITGNIIDWHHYAITFDSNRAIMYFDGREVAAANLAISRSASTATTNFGYDILDRFGLGAVDEFAVFDRALTPAEIKAQFTARAAFATDQRSATKPIDGNQDGTAAPDIGPFELDPRIIVTSSSDSSSDDGLCTLREAVTAVNNSYASGTVPGECRASPGLTKIEFAPGLPSPIVLAFEDIDITTSMTIEGPGADLLTIQGNGSERIFDVDNGDNSQRANVEISALTITGGYDVNGGGIQNFERLFLSEVGIVGNSATNIGGGLYSTDHAATIVTRSTFSDNTAPRGGAIHNQSGNGSPAVGLIVQDSTISGNHADTVGGGIENLFANLELWSTTVTNNTAGSRGGGVDISNGPGTRAAIGNSIIFGNTSGDVTGPNPLVSLGYNIVGNGNATGFYNRFTNQGDRVGIDPLLGSLADNGGSTLTHALLPGSPAIDRGAPFIADSVMDWSTTGVQGENGWTYGYYKRLEDPDGIYQTDDFIEFLNDGSGVPETNPLDVNHWNGSDWDFEANPPWTQIGETLTTAGNQHWSIRRWTSNYSGAVNVNWTFLKANTGGGSGATGKLMQNGIEVDTQTIAFNDTVGVNRNVTLLISVGDEIELVMTSLGTDGSYNDNFDLSHITARITPVTDQRGLPRPEIRGFDIGPVELAVGGSVASRSVFYENTTWDDPNEGRSDDDAIVPGVSTFEFGETANPFNYTTNAQGIKGLVVDIAARPNSETISSDDFAFRVGKTDNIGNWREVAADPTVTTRLGEGVDGSDRVILIWPEQTIRDTWLEVRVKANGATGLIDDEVFYIGNLVGDVNRDGQVNAIDFASARANQRNFLFPASIHTAQDINRDGLVNSVDLAIIRDSHTRLSGGLRLITPGGNPTPTTDDSTFLSAKTEDLFTLSDAMLRSVEAFSRSEANEPQAILNTEDLHAEIIRDAAIIAILQEHLLSKQPIPMNTIELNPIDFNIGDSISDLVQSIKPSEL